MSGTRRKPGRMGPYIDGFRARLLELGYTPGTVRNALKVAGQLGRWMVDANVAEESPVVGVGVETLGTNAGAAGSLEPPYPLSSLLVGGPQVRSDAAGQPRRAAA